MKAVSFIRRLFERVSTVTDRAQSEQTVAIACQGGGSHAAFTAGVLDRLLDDLPAHYRIAGLSGASGGAVSATAAWYGLVAENHTPATVLRGLWSEIAASSGWESWVNELVILKSQSQFSGSFAYEGSPYSNPASDWGRQQLETALCEHIDFDSFGTLAADTSAPALFVSAVTVLTGNPVIFRDRNITSEMVIASAAVPRLFEAVEINNTYYWDGFLSQNPPLLEFVIDASLPPIDELWMIRLNPKTITTLPTSAREIEDRTQRLVENLSLTHERRFIETINEWVNTGKLSDPSLTETTVRTIDLHREQTKRSRLNRRSSFISDLYADGKAEADNFLNELNDADSSQE